MSKTKILTVVFGLIAAGLSYYLFNSVNGSIQEAKRIVKLEERVIERLKLVRDAQTGYKSVNGSYTNDWKKLLAFVDSGRFYITNKREFIKAMQYGKDSIWIEIDTLGTVTVRDSLFNAQRAPSFDFSSFSYVPGSNPPVQFAMWADKITKAGLQLDAIEVWDPKPGNPARDEKSDLTTKKPLRFGSRVSITTAGNWE